MMPMEATFTGRRNNPGLVMGKLSTTPQPVLSETTRTIAAADTASPLFAIATSALVVRPLRTAHGHVPGTTVRQGAGACLSALPAGDARVAMRGATPSERHSGTQAFMTSKRTERRTPRC